MDLLINFLFQLTDLSFTWHISLMIKCTKPFKLLGSVKESLSRLKKLNLILASAFYSPVSFLQFCTGLESLIVVFKPKVTLHDCEFADHDDLIEAGRLYNISYFDSKLC